MGKDIGIFLFIPFNFTKITQKAINDAFFYVKMIFERINA